MDKIENYDQQYAEYYQTEYESVLSRFEEYQKLHSNHTQSKIRKDFKRKVSSEMKSIVEKEEPSSIPNVTVVRENKYKLELIGRFKIRGENYMLNPVTSFLKEELPIIHQEHLKKLRSGNYKNDYEWDTDFIENHSTDDVLQMLAKYFALYNFKNEIEIFKNSPKHHNRKEISVRPSGLVRKSNSDFTLLNSRQTGLFHQLFTEKETRVYLNTLDLTTKAQSMCVGILSAFSSDTVKEGLQADISKASEDDKKAILKILEKAIKKLS